MPHFTLQLAQHTSAPLLLAYLGVGQARRSALQTANQTIPQPVALQALVDTGASHTCVEHSILQSLGLTAKGQVTVNTPTTGEKPQMADEYDVSLIIPGAFPTDLPLAVENMPVIAAELFMAQGFHALIGRDVLEQCILVYNGSVGTFALAF